MIRYELNDRWFHFYFSVFATFPTSDESFYRIIYFHINRKSRDRNGKANDKIFLPSTYSAGGVIMSIQRKEESVGKNGYLEKMRKTILRHRMIDTGDIVVAGLSGGPDSASLLLGLVMLREELGIRHICAVHVNHGLRGEEAARDEAYSRHLAESLGVEFRSFHFCVGEAAKRWKMGSEEAGRRIRYDTFASVSREIGARKTAVAHNSDDQAETILMRILRGTGIRGLTGIEYVREAGEGRIIRPVLDISRREIESFCRENGLTPVRDSTNDRPVYTRNKIRLELLPYLKEEYNPAVELALVRLGKSAKEDDDYLTSEAGKIIKKCWNTVEKSLDTGETAEIHPAVLKRVIRQAAEAAGAGRDLDEKKINAVVDLIKREREGKETDLLHGNYVLLSYGKLWFLKRNDTVKAEAVFPSEELEKRGHAIVEFGGRKIMMRLGTAQEIQNERKKKRGPEKKDAENSEKMKKTELYLDWERLKRHDGLVFRFRRPGDKIRLRGMKGRKKLQDYFVDRRIPRHLRDQTLLLADGSDIFFAGSDVSSECCEKPDSISIVSIEY